MARSKLLASERGAMTPPVAAAVELAVVLMGLSEEERAALPGSATALSRRFTTQQISDAFSHLRLQNFVYHDFNLSQDFKTLRQVSESSLCHGSVTETLQALS